MPGLNGLKLRSTNFQVPSHFTAGWKNRKSKIPANPYALFKIANIIKLYFAAATVNLVNQECLSLDKTLTGYLPDLAERIEYAETLNMQLLLQHRFGIPDFIDHPDFP